MTDKGSSCCGLNKTRSEEKGRIRLKECRKNGVEIKIKKQVGEGEIRRG